MPVSIVVGKLGSGKSLYSGTRIYRHFRLKRKVAVNFDLFLKDRKDLPDAEAWRIPSQPKAADLYALGRGGPNEEEAGLLVLDECAMWLNSRNWQDKDRQDVITWLLHSRKLGWDVVMIVQDINALDKQVRNMLGEYLISLSRLDRLKVPFIGVKMPQIHLASIRYGMNPQNPPIERDWFRPSKEVYSLYDTGHIFSVEDKPVHRIEFFPKPPNRWKILADKVINFYKPMPVWWRFVFTFSLPVHFVFHHLGFYEDQQK